MMERNINVHQWMKMDFVRFARKNVNGTNIKIEEETIILDDLKKRYFELNNELSLQKKLFSDKKQELNNFYFELLNNKDSISLSINKLKSIALKKSIESEEDFFNMLIEVEKSEHKSEWQTRIRILEELKNQDNLLTEIYNGTNIQINKIKEFIEYELHVFN